MADVLLSVNQVARGDPTLTAGHPITIHLVEEALFRNLGMRLGSNELCLNSICVDHDTLTVDELKGHFFVIAGDEHGTIVRVVTDDALGQDRAIRIEALAAEAIHKVGDLAYA